MRLASGDRIEAGPGPPLVEYVNPDPQVSIDLKRLNPMYNMPLVITIEQATQLLRELDAVIL